ncbi:hypothetical protein ABBQ38_008567 [Trebouxia sp. C0009 RCD-2024]
MEVLHDCYVITLIPHRGLVRLTTLQKVTWRPHKGQVLVNMVGPLCFLGFGAQGPVAGSIAAVWQASIALGNGVGLVSGSLLALLQSAGTTSIWGIFGGSFGVGGIVAALIATIFGGRK